MFFQISDQGIRPDRKLLGITFYLCVVYDWGTQTYLAIEASENIDHQLAIAAIKKAVAFAGTVPLKFMVSDNGWQFIQKDYRAILDGLRVIDIQIPPGKPWLNGSLESGNKDLRKLLYTIALYHVCENTTITKAGTSKKEILDFIQECCRKTQEASNREISRIKFKTTPITAFENKVDDELKKMEDFKTKKQQERKERAKKQWSKKKRKIRSLEDKVRIGWKKAIKDWSYEKLHAFNELIHGRFEIIAS